MPLQTATTSTSTSDYIASYYDAGQFVSTGFILFVAFAIFGFWVIMSKAKK